MSLYTVKVVSVYQVEATSQANANLTIETLLEHEGFVEEDEYITLVAEGVERS